MNPYLSLRNSSKIHTNFHTMHLCTVNQISSHQICTLIQLCYANRISIYTGRGSDVFIIKMGKLILQTVNISSWMGSRPISLDIEGVCAVFARL